LKEVSNWLVAHGKTSYKVISVQLYPEKGAECFGAFLLAKAVKLVVVA